MKRVPRSSPPTLPAWEPPETSSRPVSGPQPFSFAGPRVFGHFADHLGPGVGGAVEEAAFVVVAVVRGGALVDVAVGGDADVDRFPVVVVFWVVERPEHREV